MIDMRYFGRSKFFGGLVQKKSSQVVFSKDT